MSNYYEADPLPDWTTPIMEAHTIHSNFYSLLMDEIETSGAVTNDSLMELIRAMFVKYDNTTPDEDTMRSVLKDVETLYSDLDDITVTLRSTLVSSAVTYAKALVGAKATTLTTISGTSYTVPTDIGG